MYKQLLAIDSQLSQSNLAGILNNSEIRLKDKLKLLSSKFNPPMADSVYCSVTDYRANNSFYDYSALFVTSICVSKVVCGKKINITMPYFFSFECDFKTKSYKDNNNVLSEMNSLLLKSKEQYITFNEDSDLKLEDELTKKVLELALNNKLLKEENCYVVALFNDYTFFQSNNINLADNSAAIFDNPFLNETLRKKVSLMLESEELNKSTLDYLFSLLPSFLSGGNPARKIITVDRYSDFLAYPSTELDTKLKPFYIKANGAEFSFEAHCYQAVYAAMGAKLHREDNWSKFKDQEQFMKNFLDYYTLELIKTTDQIEEVWLSGLDEV